MKTILILLLALPCAASSPKYKHKDANLDDEVRNIYYLLSVKPEFVVPHLFTLAQIQSFSPTRAGEIYYCSTCVTDALCISTGTTRGAFSRVSARTTACQ